MNIPLVSRPDLWKQYEITVDLYKHYLKLTIELNVFYYAIMGAILSFYFAHRTEAGVRYALCLPIIMSVLLAVLFICGGTLNRVSRDEMFRVRDALGLRVAPDFAVLSYVLRIIATLMIVVAVTLSGILVGCLNGA